MLETAEDVEVELYISYVVSKAKWSPKYDIRVFSNDNTMKVRVLASFGDILPRAREAGSPVKTASDRPAGQCPSKNFSP